MIALIASNGKGFLSVWRSFTPVRMLISASDENGRATAAAPLALSSFPSWPQAVTAGNGGEYLVLYVAETPGGTVQNLATISADGRLLRSFTRVFAAATEHSARCR